MADLPEVSLVAILHADKEGFLRSATSLIQIIGRAARNVDGQVIMYADNVTDSMKRAINETSRRRRRQREWNEEHGIDPQTVRKRVSDILELVQTEAPGRRPPAPRGRAQGAHRPGGGGFGPAGDGSRGGNARGGQGSSDSNMQCGFATRSTS